MNRCQESEPALIFDFFSISASPERSEELVANGERQLICQYIIYVEERLDPHRVGYLPHVLTIPNKAIHIWSRRKS